MENEVNSQVEVVEGMTKHCIKCGEVKMLDDFTNSKLCKDGKHSWCRGCVQEYARIRYYAKRGRPVPPAKKIPAQGMKICTKCGEEKGLDAFHNDKACNDGKRPSCKACEVRDARTRYYVKQRLRATPAKKVPTYGMKVCSKCKKEKPYGEFGKRKIASDGLQSWCRCCVKICQQKYSQTKKGKAARAAGVRRHAKTEKRKVSLKRYRQSEKGKVTLKKYQQSEKGVITCKKYQQSEKGKATCKKRQQSEEYKATAKKYQQSEEGKAVRKAYRQSAKGRKSQRVGVKKYRQSEKGKLALEEYVQSERGKAVFAAATKKYRQTEKGKSEHRGIQQRRRARKLGATIGTIDEAAIYSLCHEQCVYCGSIDRLTTDHIIALHVGGPHCQSNLLVACKSCNSSKGVKLVEEWIKTRPESDQQRYKAYKKRKEEWRSARCYMWI